MPNTATNDAEDMAFDYRCQRGEDDEWEVPNVLGLLQEEVQSGERALQMMRSHSKKESQSVHKPCCKSYSSMKPI